MPYYPPRQYQQPEDHPPHKRNTLRRIILLASILLIAYGAVRLTVYGADLASSRRTAQSLRELAAGTDGAGESAPAETQEAVSSVPQSTLSPAPAVVLSAEQPDDAGMLPAVEYPNGYELVPKIQTLRKTSEYIIGWIRMDDLDEPVAMKDNSFFLNHDATGKRNSNGAIFMDQGTNLLSRPYTILLYGHNMKTGAMFGNLRKYEDFSYYYKHRTFQFDTLYEEGQYAIFAVSNISVTPGKAKFVNLTALQSMNREKRQRALDQLIDLSTNKTAVDVNEEDQLLLLITCVGDDDERLVVAARRLRDGEQPDHLQMTAASGRKP